MFDLRQKILKVAFTELWVGLGVIIVAAAVCLPSTGAAGFGCLVAGTFSGVLISPLIAKLLWTGTEGKLREAQKTIEQQTAELDRIKSLLNASELEISSLKTSSIEASDLSPVLKLMLLRWKWKVWDPRDIDMGDGLTYHGLRTIDLTANLGVDFEQLKWVESNLSIDVYGFRRARLFDDIGKRQWVYKEVWEKNAIMPGDTVYVDHEKLHQYTEQQDNELESRVNSSGIDDCEGIDQILKEACRRLIRLAFKGTSKPINFLEGEPPSKAMPLVDRFSSQAGQHTKDVA